MVGLTKKQRNQIYKIALEVYTTKNIQGMCWALEIALFVVINGWDIEYSFDHSNSEELSWYSPYENIEQYPEIVMHRPEKYSMWWFPVGDKLTRETIFVQAIEATS